MAEPGDEREDDRGDSGLSTPSPSSSAGSLFLFSDVKRDGGSCGPIADMSARLQVSAKNQSDEAEAVCVLVYGTGLMIRIAADFSSACMRLLRLLSESAGRPANEGQREAPAEGASVMSSFDWTSIHLSDVSPQVQRL